jgi:hypothetical protein
MDCSAERSVAVTTKSFPTMPSSVSIACVYVCVYGGGCRGVRKPEEAQGSVPPVASHRVNVAAREHHVGCAHAVNLSLTSTFACMHAYRRALYLAHQRNACA